MPDKQASGDALGRVIAEALSMTSGASKRDDVDILIAALVHSLSILRVLNQKPSRSQRRRMGRLLIAFESELRDLKALRKERQKELETTVEEFQSLHEKPTS